MRIVTPNIGIWNSWFSIHPFDSISQSMETIQKLVQLTHIQPYHMHCTSKGIERFCREAADTQQHSWRNVICCCRRFIVNLRNSCSFWRQRICTLKTLCYDSVFHSLLLILFENVQYTSHIAIARVH